MNLSFLKLVYSLIDIFIIGSHYLNRFLFDILQKYFYFLLLSFISNDPNSYLFVQHNLINYHILYCPQNICLI